MYIACAPCGMQNAPYIKRCMKLPKKKNIKLTLTSVTNTH